jgi:hypothetical protein
MCDRNSYLSSTTNLGPLFLAKEANPNCHGSGVNNKETRTNCEDVISVIWKTFCFNEIPKILLL